MKQKALRKQDYDLLIDCGFDSKMATKYKNYKHATVEELCKIKRESQKSIDPIEKETLKRFESILRRN